LGGLAFTAFICLAASGTLLLFYYIPLPEEAYKSVLFIDKEVFAGNFIRTFHHYSANLFLILIFLHTLRVIFTGSFAFRRYNWAIGLFILLFAILSGYTGYILPMDERSFWAGRTGLELLTAFPFGDSLKSAIAPDGIEGKLTLIRLYIFHITVLPIITVILITLHLYRVRHDGGILPPL
jgi:quinol-cytochrome oxidoreductase complex cytochrome b subunit